MDENALEKAAEALLKWLENTGCQACFSRPLGSPACLMIAHCVARKLALDAESGAYTVLKAADYGKLQAVVQGVRDYYENCQCLECAPRCNENQCEEESCWGDKLEDALSQLEGLKADALP